MIEEIINGISKALFHAFGEGYRIYRNDVEQGLKEPCFFIQVLKPDVSPLLGKRALRHHPLDVIYIPAKTGDNTELFQTAEKLIECLAFITLPEGSSLRGTNMSYEEADDTLHFFVNYDCTVNAYTPGEAMDSLAIQTGIEEA